MQASALHGNNSWKNAVFPKLADTQNGNYRFGFLSVLCKAIVEGLGHNLLHAAFMELILQDEQLVSEEQLINFKERLQAICKRRDVIDPLEHHPQYSWTNGRSTFRRHKVHPYALDHATLFRATAGVVREIKVDVMPLAFLGHRVV